MSNLCKCGCGAKVKNKWHVGHNRKGVSPTNKNPDGYIENKRVFIYMPNHPNANNKGYIRRSHLVVEKKIRRYLKPNEIVHHEDENTLNDDEENLRLMIKNKHDRHHVFVSAKCTLKDCNNPHRARGLCKPHYNYYYKNNLKMPFKPTRRGRLK